jgi:hypothetical protein
LEFEKLKIKNYRFPWEVCGNNVVCSIQVFFRKDGTVCYARARHRGGDKRFYYHQQSLEYVNAKLRELSKIEHGQDVDVRLIEQVKVESSSFLEVEPSAGFGPATITLPR